MTNTIKMRARRLSCALLMSSAVGLVLFGQPAQAAPQQREYDAFFSSNYNYCDAVLLGAVYGEDADQGKVLIGQKILNGIGSNIPLMLAQSRRQRNECSWEDTGLSYDDAVTMAEVWGYDDPYDAKLKAARLFTQGRSQQAYNALS